MERLKEEMKLVKALGENIGYGNMIECAKALWNEMLGKKYFNDVMPTYESVAKEISEK